MAHESLCEHPPSILGNIARGEADLVAGVPWAGLQSYKLLSTGRTIIIIPDNFGTDGNTDFNSYIRLVHYSHRRSLVPY